MHMCVHIRYAYAPHTDVDAHDTHMYMCTTYRCIRSRHRDVYVAAAAQDLTTDPPKWHASNTSTTQVDSLQACSIGSDYDDDSDTICNELDICFGDKQGSTTSVMTTTFSKPNVFEYQIFKNKEYPDIQCFT